MDTKNKRFALLGRQVAMLEKELKQQSRGSQNSGFAVELTGNVSIEMLDRSLTVLCAENDALRTHFALTEEGKIVHEVNDGFAGWIKHDLSSYGEFKGSRLAFDEIKVENIAPMDIFEKAMFQFHLYFLSERKVIIYVKASHIITDGPSFKAIYSRLAQLYSGGCDISSENWSDMVSNELLYSASEIGADDRRFWGRISSQLPADIDEADLEAAGRSAVSGVSHGLFSLKKLGDIAGTAGTSVFNTVMFLYTYSLGKIFGRNDFAVNYTLSDRFTDKTRYSVGLTTHNVPNYLAGINEKELYALLKESKVQTVEAFDHYMGSDVIRPYSFTISYLSDTVRIAGWSDLEAVIHSIPCSTNSGDLSFILMCSENGDNVELSTVVDTSIYSQRFISSLFAKMHGVMELMYSRAHTKVYAKDHNAMQIAGKLRSVHNLLLSGAKNDPLSQNLGNGIVLRGSCDLDRMDKAVRALYERFDALRMVLMYTDNGERRLVVDNTISHGLYVYEAVGDTAEKRMEYAISESRKRFLTAAHEYTDSMARFWAYRISEDETIIAFLISHIVSDGTSVGVLQNMLLGLYEDLTGSGLPAAPGFLEYLTEEEKFFKTAEYKEMADYWKKKTGSYRHADIPFIECENNSIRYASVMFDTVVIKEISRKSRSANFYVIFMLLQLALSDMTGQNDIGVTYVHSGRVNVSEMNMVGTLINGIFVRSFFRKEDTWRSAIKKLMKQNDEDIKNIGGSQIWADIPFVMSYNVAQNITNLKKVGELEMVRSINLIQPKQDPLNMLVNMVNETEDYIEFFIYGDKDTYSLAFREGVCRRMLSYSKKIEQDTDIPLTELLDEKAFTVKTEEFTGEKGEFLEVPEAEAEKNSAEISMTEVDNNIEIMLRHMIKDALELDALPDPEDDFFDIGGNSFKAFFIVKNMPEKYTDKVLLSDFYSCETISELAQEISKR